MVDYAQPDVTEEEARISQAQESMFAMRSMQQRASGQGWGARSLSLPMSLLSMNCSCKKRRCEAY
eukprot:632684-Pelagomonas_calceolata.AAC.1